VKKTSNIDYFKEYFFMNENKFHVKKSKSHIGGISTNDEKGVALLFTLGFLALLLVLALAFATTSITQKKMAGNNNDTCYARMLAESAAQRVIGVLQSYDEGAQYSHCDSTTHPTLSYPYESVKNHATIDRLYKLGTANAFYWYDSYATPANINWEYVKQYDSDAKANKITGRIAYVVIPGGGLDPVKLVKNGVDEGNSYPEIRKGVEMNEINVMSLLANPPVTTPPISFTSADATKFSYFPTGLLTPASPNGTWVDFDNMFSLMGITDSNKKTTLQYWFVLNTLPEAEAFWRNNAGNSKIDFNPSYPTTTDATKDELFNRFYLPRYTDVNANGAYDSGVDTNLWNTTVIPLRTSNDISNEIIPNIMISSGTAPVPTAWPTNSDVYVKPSSPTTNNGRCIPWLDNWKDAGTFPDPAGSLTAQNVRAKQIAANLIDYCDTNSVPTTDWDGVAPLTSSSCTYMGLERTPYINEISVGIRANVWTEWPATNAFVKKLHLDIYSSVGGELINMYGDNFAAATLTISGNVTGTLSADGAVLDASNNPPTLGTKPFTDTVNVTLSTHPYLYETGSSGDTIIYSFISKDIGVLTNARVNFTAVKVQVTSAILTFGGNVVDVAFPDDASTGDWSNQTDIQAALSNSFDMRGWFSYQADDPRQNHNNADWPQATSTSVTAATVYSTFGTPGTLSNLYVGLNSTVSISTAGKDTETVADPAYIDSSHYISTAYIRNDIMQSPWELGAIHRAAKWETINLKKYNTTEGVLATGGGNAYADGDANILDQIKMTSYTTSDKKLNLKLHKDAVLYSLFHKVKLGQDYATFSGGVELTPAKIWNFTSTDTTTLLYQLKEKNINFFSRGCLADVTRLSDETCGTQSNDRQKEEIIGKVINLTGISASDYFTIIVLAQTIKDIGGGITISKDLDMNGTIGTASEVVLHSDINGNNNATDTGISETITNCAFGAYDQYADEILAEQKIKAEIYRNPDTKKITILRYEYIEE
jgi:hypothetical protein